MSVILEEGDLRFTFDGAIHGVKLDAIVQNRCTELGLAKTMKSVDFMVEFEDYVWFIEVTDLESPAIPTDDKTRTQEKQRNLHLNSKHYETEVMQKIQSSLLFLTLESQITNKKICYTLFFALETLTSHDLMTARGHIRKACWLPSELTDWRSRFDANVANITAWRRIYKEHFVERISTKTT